MRLSAPIYQLKRRAKALARDERIPLHEAQDRIARDEGFETWSLLSSRMTSDRQIALLPNLVDGDTLLIAARPGHGKTLLGLQLLLDAARERRRAVFFTLEYTDQEVVERLRSLDDKGIPHTPEIVTSSDISADFHHPVSVRRATRNRRRRGLSANPRSTEKQATSLRTDACLASVCP